MTEQEKALYKEKLTALFTEHYKTETGQEDYDDYFNNNGTALSKKMCEVIPKIEKEYGITLSNKYKLFLKQNAAGV